MPNFRLPDEVFEEAARRFSTPFHLYDEQGILDTAKKLNAAFAWAPHFQEYFAVKALPNPAVLKLYHEAGCGLDCSSECELLLAEMAGFSGEDIMFSANAMPPEEFAHARRLNAIVNLDDLTDIDILEKNGGVPETVCVRYNPGGNFTLGNAIMGEPGESKYGWTKEQMLEGLPKLKALGAKKFGLHAFLASSTMDNSYYPRLAGILFDLGAEMEKETGLTLAFINLSGGIGIPYRPEEKAPDIDSVGRGVREEYQRAFGDPVKGNVGITAELGR